MKGTVKQDWIGIRDLSVKRRYPPLPDFIEKLFLGQVNHRIDRLDITLYIFKATKLLYYTMTIAGGQ